MPARFPSVWLSFFIYLFFFKTEYIFRKKLMSEYFLYWGFFCSKINTSSRSSRPEVFLEKGVLRHGCFPVNLRNIFGAPLDGCFCSPKHSCCKTTFCLKIYTLAEKKINLACFKKRYCSPTFIVKIEFWMVFRFKRFLKQIFFKSLEKSLKHWEKFLFSNS